MVEDRGRWEGRGQSKKNEEETEKEYRRKIAEEREGGYRKYKTEYIPLW